LAACRAIVFHPYTYSRARDRMLEAIDTAQVPWYIVGSDNKRRTPV